MGSFFTVGAVLTEVDACSLDALGAGDVVDCSGASTEADVDVLGVLVGEGWALVADVIGAMDEIPPICILPPSL